MPAHSNVEDLLKKLARPAEKVGNKRFKEPWRHRKSQRAGSKLTDLERQERKDKHEKKRDNLNDALTTARETMYKFAEAMSDQFDGAHSADYYYRLIMQQPKIKIKPKKISNWNAFVHKEMKELNEGQSHGDRERLHTGGHMKELSARWKSMTEEEQAAAVGDGVGELEERRENRKEGVHNVLINSFHDTRATLAVVQRELDNLSGRTGMCILTMAVRPTLDSYNAPFIYVSDPRVSHYVETVTKKTVLEFALRMEGFCISGVSSLTQNHRKQLNDWKNRTANLIAAKLLVASPRGEITKMYYINFDRHITFKFGVVLENWPVQKFTAPGNFSSIPILCIIYSAFESGAARFRSLSDEEWQTWRQEFLTGKNAPAVSLNLSPLARGAASDNALEDMPEDMPDDAPDDAPGTTPDSASDNSDAMLPGNSDANPPLNPDSMQHTGPTAETSPAPAISATASPISPATSAPTATPTPDLTAARGKKRPIDQVDNGGNTVDVFVNNVSGTEGLVQITKRPCKKRSDAGVKRGPRKKAAATPASLPAAAA